MSINNKATEVCAIRTLRAGKKPLRPKHMHGNISKLVFRITATRRQTARIQQYQPKKRTEEKRQCKEHTPNTFRCTTILFFVGSRLILIWIINRPNRRNVHDVLSSQPPNREHEYYWAVAKYRNIIPEKKYPSKRYCLRSCVAKCAVSVTVWRS